MGLMLATWPHPQHLAMPRCACAGSDGDIRALPPVLAPSRLPKARAWVCRAGDGRCHLAEVRAECREAGGLLPWAEHGQNWPQAGALQSPNLSFTSFP